MRRSSSTGSYPAPGGPDQLFTGPESLVVYLVEDEFDIRLTLKRVLESVHITCHAYESAEEFLEAYEPGGNECLVLDMRLPGRSGLELQRIVRDRGYSPPVVFISAYGDASAVAQAMKNGAHDFITKPFSYDLLIDVIRRAVHAAQQERRAAQVRKDIEQRLARLNAGEAEVLEYLCAGFSTKQIALKLAISDRTIEARRRRLREKLEVESLAQMVALKLIAGCGSCSRPEQCPFDGLYGFRPCAQRGADQAMPDPVQLTGAA